MVRALLLAGLTLALTGPTASVRASSSRSGVPAPVSPPVTYSAPLDGRLDVIGPFEAPAGPYAPGHRGVDLAAAPGRPVHAAGAGTVSFAGPVAGRGVVVISHADGVRTEYEPVESRVRAGQVVGRGETIGTVRGRHGSCVPQRCLHWGARRGEQYFDPMTLLRPLGPVRLLPWS